MRRSCFLLAALTAPLLLATWADPASGQLLDKYYGPGIAGRPTVGPGTSTVDTHTTLRTGPAYNPAIRVPQALKTTTGISPYQSGAYRAARRSRPVPHTSSSVAGYSRMLGSNASRGGLGTSVAPPAKRQPPQPSGRVTSLGTARYMAANPAGSNYLAGNSLPSLGGLYANDAYVSSAYSRAYYATPQPVPQVSGYGPGHRPFDNLNLPASGTNVYRKYWPLMLERDEQGRYLLDAADIYLMTRPGF